MSAAVDVSVVIAAYEASGFIEDAIQSSLAQSGVTLEVIVVDDGSKLPCRDAVEQAANGDLRVRYIEMEQNGGPSAARNRGFAAATGTYIAVLDSDDAFLQGRLQALVEKAKSTGADIVVDNMWATTDLSDPGTRYHFLDNSKISGDAVITIDDYIDPLHDETYGRPLGYLKPLFLRSFLQTRKITYDTTLTNSEDFYLVAEMLAQGAKMVLVPYTGYLYLVREGSISYRLNPRQTRAILAAEAKFQTHYSKTLSATGKAAAKRRLAVMSRVHEFEVLVDDLRRKQLFSFLAHLVANPRTIAAHLGQFAQIARKKL